MIKVSVVYHKNLLQSISIHGHAMYDDYGKDIVCSAVSSIVTTSINSILALKDDGIVYRDSSGDVLIHHIKQDDIVLSLLEVMLHLLSDLEKDYPNHIRISKEEDE